MRKGRGLKIITNIEGGGSGQGQNRTADTRIFSPETVPGLCVTIGRQVNEFNSFCCLRYEPIYRFEHIVAYSSGKVVAKLAAILTEFSIAEVGTQDITVSKY